MKNRKPGFSGRACVSSVCRRLLDYSTVTDFAKWPRLPRRRSLGAAILSEAKDLLYSHGFRQVSRLVHVAAAAHRDVIGQQLHGDDFQDGR